MEPLDRIEAKLDALNDKLDSHLERIAKLENSEGWFRVSFGLVVSALGTLFYRLFMEK